MTSQCIVCSSHSSEDPLDTFDGKPVARSAHHAPLALSAAIYPPVSACLPLWPPTLVTFQLSSAIDRPLASVITVDYTHGIQPSIPPVQ